MKTYIYYHKMDQNIQSKDLIQKALNHYLKELGREADCHTLELIREKESKKPYLKDYSDIYYNVSHSGDWWAGAFGLIENGLDLQESKAKDLMKMARRYYHPAELAWLQKQDPEQRTAQFYRLWAYNESYIKFLGDGLTKGLAYFSVIDEKKDGPGIDQEGVFQQEIPFKESYWMVLTTAMPTEVELIPLRESRFN